MLIISLIKNLLVASNDREEKCLLFSLSLETVVNYDFQCVWYNPSNLSNLRNFNESFLMNCMIMQLNLTKVSTFYRKIIMINYDTIGIIYSQSFIIIFLELSFDSIETLPNESVSSIIIV